MKALFTTSTFNLLTNIYYAHICKGKGLFYSNQVTVTVCQIGDNIYTHKRIVQFALYVYAQQDYKY